MSINKYLLKAKAIITPDEFIENASIQIENKKIKEINPDKKTDIIFDLGNKIIFPGLINAHDHLLGNYYPRVGSGPYLNWLPWDNDLKSSPVYTERSKIPPKIIYELGSYRNLFSGTTTVSDHIPHFVNEPYIKMLPIRILTNYTLAHECSKYDLRWGDGIEIEYKKAIKNNYSFITHVEEGYDKEAEEGIDVLLKNNALGEYSVLVHAISLSDKDIQEVSKHKSNLIWCPNSNMFMFNRTGDVKKWLSNKINVSIGTDSPMSGGLNLLDEMHFGKKIFKNIYKQDIDDRTLVNMVTCNPAKAFRMENSIGSIRKGALADLLVLDGNVKKPYVSLINGKLEDVSLVFFEGMPLYGDKEYKDIFKKFNVKTSKFKIRGKEKLCIGDPLCLLKKIRQLVGFKKNLPFFPVE